VRSKKLRLTFVAQQASTIFQHHLRHPGDARRDAGQRCRHGLHEHGWQVVLAAITFCRAGEGEDLGLRCETSSDFIHAEWACELDVVREMQLGDLLLQGVLQRSFPDDATLKIDAPVAQEATGVDEVLVALLFDETAHTQYPAWGGTAICRHPRRSDGGKVKPVVYPLHSGCSLRVLLSQLPRGVIADRHN